MNIDDKAEERRKENLDRRRENFLRDFIENSELYTFGIITQTGYRELQQQLERQAQEVQGRFHRWFIVGLIAYAIIALSSAVALAGFGIVLTDQNNTTTQIQQQRHDFTRSTCVDQNQRHDLTGKKLIAATRQAIHRTPGRKAEIQRSSQTSLTLIDALVPKRNCEEVARKATEGRG
jgi:hypothetical protein